ncbi:hypothetical protein PFISCL1PPCAC_26040, partial [Pristionchus fissidentatus]
GMTKKLLDIYIKLNHINGPLTTGAPIDFPVSVSLFPYGTMLQVNRQFPLNNDGSPIGINEAQFIQVTNFEDDSTSAPA